MVPLISVHHMSFKGPDSGAPILTIRTRVGVLPALAGMSGSDGEAVALPSLRQDVQNGC